MRAETCDPPHRELENERKNEHDHERKNENMDESLT